MIIKLMLSICNKIIITLKDMRSHTHTHIKNMDKKRISEYSIFSFLFLDTQNKNNYKKKCIFFLIYLRT